MKLKIPFLLLLISTTANAKEESVYVSDQELKDLSNTLTSKTSGVKIDEDTSIRAINLFGAGDTIWFVYGFDVDIAMGDETDFKALEDSMKEGLKILTS